MSLSDYIATATPLAIIDSLEQEMRVRIDGITRALSSQQPDADPVSGLAAFLRADRDFLGVILSLMNLSQEKFLRILSAERFAKGDYATEWNINMIHAKLRREAGFAERMANLLVQGRTSPMLVANVAAFYLDQLDLPANWPEMIRDPKVIGNAIRKKLTGDYTDKKGKAIEGMIRARLDAIQSVYGVTHTKGQVHLVRKEVDHAIPNLQDAYVLIMTSYMETTSSSQTARANEQTTIYTDIQQENIRYGRDKRIMVNFVDGAGWLARRTDLRKLYDGCDYILNLKTLDRLEAIICKHVPARFFTTAPRPQIKGN
jgi:hypothetical protein